VVAASTTGDEPFPPNTESQIAHFTELVATAIENGAARAELRRMADQQAALRRVATLVARGVTPDPVFAAVADEVTRLTGADVAMIVRFDPEGIATLVAMRGPSGTDLGRARVPPKPEANSPSPAVLAPGESRFLVDVVALEDRPEFVRDTGAWPTISVPIMVEGRSWGTISVQSRHDPLPPDTEQRLAEFTELVATAIANAEARTKLMQSRARIVATADATRRRIERDLHDGAQQRLISLALELRLAENALPADLPGLRNDIGKTAAGLNAVLEELREISRGLHPAILSEGGLGPALRALARRAAVPVAVTIETSSRYPPPIEVAAYYVVSEALTNTAKHAKASHAEVVVREVDGTLHLTVSDDGVGGAHPQHVSGLIGLHDRVEALGGAVDVTSPPGEGTVIQVLLPVHPTDDPPRLPPRAG
jgi:signal transduction histidine kinase